LKAVVLDFSTVNNVDLTSVQVLVDIRSQLDRFAAPDTVQWHFASVNNRWTKRALAAAGFGRPTPTSSDRSAALKQPISTVAELADTDSEAMKTGKSTIEQFEDIELGVLPDPDEITGKGKAMVTTTALSASQVGIISGANFPFFHVDLESAIQSASLFGRAEGSTSDNASGEI
jgi:sodium-independent sulfate anion transporter 11